MELNPVEAVRNNALATRLMARIAGEIGVKRFVLVSTDKAVDAGDGHGRLQGAGRVGRRGGPGPLARHALRDRALRQRARLLGLGRPDLPPPDRARRPGDGHRRAHDALLHDDPGGRPARHPRRLAGQRRRDLRARDGRAGLDLAAGRDDDRALGAAARRGHRDRGSSAAGRARSSTRSSSTPTSARSPRPPRRSCAPSASRWTRDAVETMFDEIGLLVLEGDAAALAAKVSELSELRASTRARRRARRGARRDGPSRSLAWRPACRRFWPSRSPTRSTSTAPTPASPRSSGSPCCRCSTSPRRARSSACASGRAARPSARPSCRTARPPPPSSARSSPAAAPGDARRRAARRLSRRDRRGPPPRRPPARPQGGPAAAPCRRRGGRPRRGAATRRRPRGAAALPRRPTPAGQPSDRDARRQRRRRAVGARGRQRRRRRRSRHSALRAPGSADAARTRAPGRRPSDERRLAPGRRRRRSAAIVVVAIVVVRPAHRRRSAAATTRRPRRPTRSARPARTPTPAEPDQDDRRRHGRNARRGARARQLHGRGAQRHHGPGPGPRRRQPAAEHQVQDRQRDQRRDAGPLGDARRVRAGPPRRGRRGGQGDRRRP